MPDRLTAVLFEAYISAIKLLPQTLKNRFVLIGGTSMLALGSMRKTADVDVAITAESLNAFQEAAAKDSHFSVDAMRTWSYTSPTLDICVQFEFLAMNGGFIHTIRAQRPFRDGFRAGLGELAIMKANAFESREEDNDMKDFIFVLDLLENNTSENFRGIDIDEDDRYALTSAAIKQGGKYPRLLESLLLR